MGTAHPSTPTSNITRLLLTHSPTSTLRRTFAVEYRLSTSYPLPTSGQVPSAILDGAAGYAYLLSLGFLASNISILGDSAGGNLALALVRYLIEEQMPNLPPPRGLILHSPWADLNC